MNLDRHATNKSPPIDPVNLFPNTFKELNYNYFSKQKLGCLLNEIGPHCTRHMEIF